jgi:hypothetical protein
MCSTRALPAEAYCKASTKGFGSSVDVPAKKHKSLDAQRMHRGWTRWTRWTWWHGAAVFQWTEVCAVKDGCRRIEPHVIYCCEKRGSSKFATGVCLYRAIHASNAADCTSQLRQASQTILFVSSVLASSTLTQQQWHDAHRLEFARSSRPRHR